ncbi:hypothetical protein AMAG_05156 [Allomyces macrogynus ATCC 38327]|uniref:Uncharacterized protein n=1 Tax=Allomyces macrogynus (strain ATCC 38327) TaxID=578462 RepID=A0A0L0SAT8_ALLM3|nr:hypothetical protein AMAG_05156 [Allomyces macrogynus ATCC 38327]|eukprot:KNE59693.1 hypothetical protein AMAG_05156 [Allomyces macrogynus ATCC 38327]
MGTVMAGLSSGNLLLPAIGSGLYARLGPHSPYCSPETVAKKQRQAAAIGRDEAMLDDTVAPLYVLMR